MLIYISALIVLLAIILFIREYYLSIERLTGNYYKRQSIGFIRPYYMVECKKNGQTYTRRATKEEETKLQNKRFNELIF